MPEGRLQIIARGSDVAAIRNQTIRVNVANANALKAKRDAFVRYVRALNRAIDWAYSGDAAIDAYAAIAKVPRELAKSTRDEFYPKASLQLAEVKGLDLTLQAGAGVQIHHRAARRRRRAEGPDRHPLHAAEVNAPVRGGLLPRMNGATHLRSSRHGLARAASARSRASARTRRRRDGRDIPIRLAPR